MSGVKLEIVTPGDIDPDLITVQDFGPHVSRVRKNERIWTFENPIYANKFMKVSHLPKYKRKKTDG